MASRPRAVRGPLPAQVAFASLASIAALTLAMPRAAAQACGELVDPMDQAACHERAGRTATAWTVLHAAASRFAAVGRVEEAAALRDRAALLAPELARVIVSVPAPARRPAGLEVRRDGVVVSATAQGIALPVDPGEHVVRARAPGKRRWKRRVTVAPGSTVEVMVPLLEPLDPRSSEGSSEDIDEDEPRPAARSGSLRPALAIALGSVGGAAAAAGAVFGVLALVKQSRWIDETKLHCQLRFGACDSITSVLTIKRIEEDRRRFETVSNIGLVGGGAAIVGAVVLGVLSRGGAPPPAVRVAPLLGPALAGAVFEGTF